MNDKELANKVVAIGVGGKNVGNYWIDPDDDALGWLPEEDFVRDWRVAGALMEKMCDVHAYWDDIGWSCKVTERLVTGQKTGIGVVDALDREYHDLPHAIIEACVEALCEQS